MSEPSKASGWHHTPRLPVRPAPYWDRPARPVAAFVYLARSWRPVSDRALFLLIAVGVWLWATPELSRTATFQLDWMAEVWLRNFILISIVAGGLHIWLHIWRRQGDDTHYDTRPFLKNNGRFTFRNQVHDNMFWTLGTGVLIWSGYECLMLWAFANGIAPYISFADNPVWFICLLVIIPFWAGAFFYLQHRVLHIGILYKHIHSWHHKNLNTGPWSGLAMHPAEQLILMADTLIYFVVASHPVHVIFNLLFHGLGAATSHAGFDKLRLGVLPDLQLGDFFHQLHHKYFDCNYGTLDTPWDHWFGTFHDGTKQGNEKMTERRRKLARQTNQ